MNLFIEYHRSKHLIRHSEFITCLHENLGNEFIDHIQVFTNDIDGLNFKHDKMTVQYSSGERITFKEIFKGCNEFANNQIWIIANADIIFDDSLSILNRTKLDGVFLALSRWDIKPDGSDVLYNNSASQDAWIFKTPIVIPEKIMDQMNFPVGACWGCDNRIAYLMDKAGYEVRNPAKQIRIKHFHLSDYRKYTLSARVDGPYMCVTPNGDINAKSECVRLQGFDNLGQPIKC